jgi:cytochrome c biogenesis protein CcmG, thiol:disulfide interchange protein DsbE
MKKLISYCILFLIAIQSHLAFSSDKLQLHEYKGKVVYIDFWASWCIPCRKSFPWMNEMQQKYGKDLVVIGVNVDQEKALADQFIKETSPQFKIVFDSKGVLATEYQVAAMPSSFIVDRQGKIIFKHLGFHEKKKSIYESEIQQLINQQ